VAPVVEVGALLGVGVDVTSEAPVEVEQGAHLYLVSHIRLAQPLRCAVVSVEALEVGQRLSGIAVCDAVHDRHVVGHAGLGKGTKDVDGAHFGASVVNPWHVSYL
jgi:hypothetical protein